MKGAARVFAGELERTTFSLATQDPDCPVVPVTPTGARCGSIYLAGALLEVQDTGRDLVRARVAEPTGAFELSAGRMQAGAADALRAMSPPCFVTVTGSAKIYTGGGQGRISIAPDAVLVVDREIRDLWILTTADQTLRRIDAIRDLLGSRDLPGDTRELLDHYGLDKGSLREIAGIVETALASIRPVPVSGEPGGDESREAIIGIIRQNSGPRGIAIDDVVAKAGDRGISPDAAVAIVRALVEEDECYQPQKGLVKLL